MSTNENTRRFEVFTIREYMQDKQQKSQWTKIGVAFENQDGSWNLRLHALPLANPKTGLAELHMRAPRPKEEKDEKGDFSASNGMEDFIPRSDMPF